MNGPFSWALKNTNEKTHSPTHTHTHKHNSNPNPNLNPNNLNIQAWQQGQFYKQKMAPLVSS